MLRASPYDDQVWFENAKGGNCLFESLAQIFEPYDISEGNMFRERVAPLAKDLRNLISWVSLDAYENTGKYSFIEEGKLMDTGVGKLDLARYSEYIKRDKTWGDDEIFEWASHLMNVTIVFEQSPDESSFVEFPMSKTYDEHSKLKYHICLQGNQGFVQNYRNARGFHFRLMKHEVPHPLVPFWNRTDTIASYGYDP